MLDTTVFDDIVRGDIDPAVVPLGCKLLASYGQWQQLNRTHDSKRRALLVGLFTELDPTLRPSSAPVWHSGSFSAEGLYATLFERLRPLDKGRRKSNHQTRADVFIAQTAMLHHLVLVTDDPDLALMVQDTGGSAVCLAEFLARPG